MKQKNKELLRALFDLQPANTNLLANHLNVSVRSIKNYVREINEEQNYLYELLDETDGRRLEHLGKLYMEENAMDCYAGFAYGFRLGARMMCEIFAKENH